jgi:hypothetical protein
MLPGQSADEAFPGMFHWDCMGNWQGATVPISSCQLKTVFAQLGCFCGTLSLHHSQSIELSKLCLQTAFGPCFSSMDEPELPATFAEFVAASPENVTSFLVVITALINFLHLFPDEIRAKLPATFTFLTTGQITVCDCLGRRSCGVIGLQQMGHGQVTDQMIYPRVSGFLVDEQSSATPEMLDWWLDQACHCGLKIEFALHAALDLLDQSSNFPQKACLSRWLRNLMDQSVQIRCQGIWN